MEEIESDQAQVTEGTESEETTAVATEDNQETEVEGQSNKEGVEEAAESKLFKMPDGRELTADEVFKEHTENLLPEFTKKSQRLAELERAEAARKAESEAAARQASQEVLKDVPADVQEAIIQVVKPLFQQQMDDLAEQNRQKEEQKQRDEADQRFKTKLSDLEKKFDGKNPDLVGIPKFDGKAILKEMQKEDNQVFDPELFFMLKHQAKFMDLEVRKALKKQAGGNRTESTGTTASSDRGTKSTGKTPKTIREASQAFLNRVASINSD